MAITFEQAKELLAKLTARDTAKRKMEEDPRFVPYAVLYAKAVVDFHTFFEGLVELEGPPSP